MSLRDYSDVYVTRCCRVLPTYREGLEHERYCAACQRLARGLDDDYDEEDDDETDLERQ